jgi:uncharacterized protein (TIGR02594 family)
MTMTNKEIQAALVANGFDVGPAGADGDIGPNTIKAIESFQRAKGLAVDGLAGPKTQVALKGETSAAPLKLEPAMPPWLVLAEADIGTVEGIGKNNSPKVLAYFRDAGFSGIKEDAVAWCAAFVGAQLQRAGFKPSGSLAARSYEGWGVGLKEPALGCIATKKRGGSAWQGHVGIVVGANKDQIFLLGGNQGDKVSIAAFKRSEFTSYRWPKDFPPPVSTKLPTTIAGAKAGVSES